MGASTLGQLGQYQLVGVLGIGGMGTVFLGRTPGGRPVAVKAVHPSLATSADFRSRFRREVALARRVGGPFTAAVLDADPEHEPPWLATEYIHGQSLAQVLNKHGALPEHTVRALAAGLAEALGVIHAAGVIHRDLKPSNVLLSETGPRVIDFGIAKAVEGIDLTGDGPLLGTPGYMSPEHLAGRPLAPSSDVFSLGTVLAHAATGMAPFGAGQSFAVAHRVSTAPPDLSQVPPNLAKLIQPCLAKDPTQRPSVDWILAQVGQFARGQSGWLPSEIGHAIRTRPMPTTPYPDAQPFPSAPQAAAAGGASAAVAPPLGFVAYLADRFARRSGTALLGPARPRPPVGVGAAASAPAPAQPAGAPPVGSPPVGSPPVGARPVGAPPGVPFPGAPAAAPGGPKTGRPWADRAEAARSWAARLGADRPGADRPGADRPGADRPGADRPGAARPGGGMAGPPRPGQPGPWGPAPGGPNAWQPGPEARLAAPKLQTPHQVPWQRLQCPPLRSAAGRATWVTWLLLLTVVGLFDAIAQSPAARGLLGGQPTAPPWLAGAFGTSSDLRRLTGWLPDPVTTWVTNSANPGTVASRLAVVPIALLCCVVAVRRLTDPTDHPGQWSWPLAVKTTVGWVGTVVAVLLVCRYLHTGFASLLWAVATLGWWTLLALPALALLVRRATRTPR